MERDSRRFEFEEVLDMLWSLHSPRICLLISSGIRGFLSDDLVRCSNGTQLNVGIDDTFVYASEEPDRWLTRPIHESLTSQDKAPT